VTALDEFMSSLATLRNAVVRKMGATRWNIKTRTGRGTHLKDLQATPEHQTWHGCE